jgi:hypothetical protein
MFIQSRAGVVHPQPGSDARRVPKGRSLVSRAVAQCRYDR